MTNTVRLSNRDDIINYISNELYKDEDALFDIKIIENKGNRMYILYSDKKNDTRLLIMERKYFINNRYNRYGGGGGNNPINTYITGSPRETLIVVYGNNSRVQAYRYSITNDNITYSECIKNRDYFLTVYQIPYSKLITAGVSLLNESNEKLNNK